MRFREAMERLLANRESELVVLRRLAEDMARERAQKATTTHLLAALATGNDDAARAPPRTPARRRGPLPRRARHDGRLAGRDRPGAPARTRGREPDRALRGSARSIHILFALCQEVGTAAHRALVQCGTDVTRLRMASMQLAMGLAPPRRPPSIAKERASGIVPVMAPRELPRAPSVRVAPSTPVVTTPPRPAAPKPIPAAKVMPPKKKPAREREAPRAPQSGDARFGLDPKQFPLLTQIGRNLTQLAARGELDPGRRARRGDRARARRPREAQRQQRVPRRRARRRQDERRARPRPAHRRRRRRRLLRGPHRRRDRARGDPRRHRRPRLARRAHRPAEDGDRARQGPRSSSSSTRSTSSSARTPATKRRPSSSSRSRRGEIACIGATTEEDYRRVIDSRPGARALLHPDRGDRALARGRAPRDRRRRAALREAPRLRYERGGAREGRHAGASATSRARRCPTRPCRSSTSRARERGAAGEQHVEPASRSPRS